MGLNRMSTANAAFPGPPYDIPGEQIRLRDVRTEDSGGAYVRWMNDPETIRYTESRFASFSVSDIRSYIESTRKDNRSIFLAITTRPSGRHIGNIKLGSVDWHHLPADIGLIIGEKDCWGKGFGTEAIALLSAYAFATIGLHKLSAGVYAPNTGCIKAFQRAGFTQEGLLRNQCRLEDAYVDVVVLGRVNNHHAAGPSA